MAKDPAMLWYWADWYSGTALLSRFLKGCYIDLLHAQFNNGPLSLEEIKTVLGNDFAAWGTLSKKFAVDKTGKYFNERLECEKLKREKFSDSRRKNVSKRYKKHSTYVDTSVEHMNIHMENENINKNRNEISSLGKSENPFLKTSPKIEEVERVFLQQGGTKEMALHFFNHHEAMGWEIRGTPVKNFSLLTGNFIRNWNKNQKNGNTNGTKPHSNLGSAAGAEMLLNRIKKQFNG